MIIFQKVNIVKKLKFQILILEKLEYEIKIRIISKCVYTLELG
jgi:hypothetical protein